MNAKSLGDLESTLEMHNADLARSNRELEEFAYVASHDLKSPLLVVMGFLDLLQNTKADQLDDDARLYVEAAVRGAQRMERLIDDLLTYSRAGRNEHDARWVDLSVVVREAVIDCEHVVKESAIVTIGRMPTVLGNQTQLRQLFANLISNAMKYRRTTEPPQVRIEAEQRECEWLIRVIDNGVGIPAADRESVFTMFKRLEQTCDRPGSGIGLAICHRVVVAHGGSIWVESADDGGTQFCFTLPS
jgi:light-regulated signal transduction histidine kinase (bacteriophytochrome)